MEWIIMNEALADLIRISNVMGKDSTLVQGGGGNTSVKSADGKYMYIKASGTALKDMTTKKGWRRLRLDSVLSIIKDKSIAQLDAQAREIEVVNRLLLACDDEVTSGARPSVESHLHAFLDRCVIHLHPIAVGAYVNAKNGKAELGKLFKRLARPRRFGTPKSLPSLWVPYTDPGFTLAKRIEKLVVHYENRFGKKPAILFLQKHGLFISADTADAALRLVRKIIKLCSSKLKKPKAHKPKTLVYEDIVAAKLAIRKAVFDATGQYLPVDYFLTTEPLAAFMRRKDTAKLLATPAMNPDELVYANGSAIWLGPRKRKKNGVRKPLENCNVNTITRKLRALVNKGQKPAAAFLVKGMGLFVAAPKKAAPVIAEITLCSLLVRTYAAKFGGVLALTKREQDFINNWEAEAFRKKLASGEREGELKNRIAVVTGGGSGLGRSIAISLARAGAMVGIADIDTEAAEETAALIKGGSGEECATGEQAEVIAVQCNVTSEASIRRGFKAVLGNWGGLDILVNAAGPVRDPTGKVSNAAGVAPAYPLVDMPVDKWRLALEVNLTGYFLVAKEAARIMIQQGMGGSIINISSKSGLEASRNNTAYNATKAGEIHMARGWALELGEYGIRVNCLAPGDVFEGPRIWNPEDRRQRTEDRRQRTAVKYRESNTLGNDIADSVVFLCSDRARTITGQTLAPLEGPRFAGTQIFPF